MAVISQSLKDAQAGLAFSTELANQQVALFQGIPNAFGRATMSSGSVTISCPSVSATSVIVVTAMASLSAAQSLFVGTITAGTSFVVTDVAGTYAGAISYIVIS